MSPSRRSGNAPCGMAWCVGADAQWDTGGARQRGYAARANFACVMAVGRDVPIAPLGSCAMGNGK